MARAFPLRAYEKSTTLLNGLQDAALCGVRLYFGWQSWISGRGHLMHVDDVTTFFQSLGIPHPRANVYISGVTEAVGGWLLILGIFSRPIALMLMFNFLVAILTANNSFLFATPPGKSLSQMIADLWNHNGDFVSDTAFPFFFASAIIVIFGPGRYSIDWAALCKCLKLKKV